MRLITNTIQLTTLGSQKAPTETRNPPQPPISTKIAEIAKYRKGGGRFKASIGRLEQL